MLSPSFYFTALSTDVRGRHWQLFCTKEVQPSRDIETFGHFEVLEIG